jgi:hypothetical protein
MGNISKRRFLATFGTLTLAVFMDQAKASDILQSLKSEAPGPLEKELINNPKKQILLAETIFCGGCPAQYKTKCNQMDDCSAK